MGKLEHDTVAALMADIASPEVVSAIDKALEFNEQQRQELLELRKMAVRRHGEPSAAATEESPPGDDRQRLKLSVAELMEHYRNDRDSSFHQLRFKTRENYAYLMRRMAEDLGSERVAALSQERLERAWGDWSDGGNRIPMARSLVAMLRILATHGAATMKNRDCRELKLTLHDMRFERPDQPNIERPTPEHTAAIIAQAHAMNLGSIALAQAFQSEFEIRQKDVIGEWVPVNEPGDSDYIHEGDKWIHGLQWSEIDADGVLRHKTSMGGDVVELRLSDAPTVLAEFDRVRKRRGELPKKGPIIVYEISAIPYQGSQFREVWRKVATAAGVPKHIRNG